MLFSSDLDRTLIYAENFLKNFSFEEVLIFVGENRQKSYMDSLAADRLDALVNRYGLKFVPNTIRSYDEYKKIDFPGVTPEWAIISNGAHILHNDKVLEEYADFLSNLIDKDTFLEICRLVGKFDGILEDSFSVNDYLARFNIEETANADDLNIQIRNLNKQVKASKDFAIYFTPTTMFITPKVVNKCTGIKFLKEYLNEDFVIAAGDSLPDVLMLRFSDVAIIPGHGTISKNQVKLNNTVEIVSKGPSAALDILDIVEEYLVRDFNT